jgi:alkanesulfonate monooxygenase SsuD/methylene tetrahydromethanopterin reductase-like flavin-dependent oxidoreductase (luciferase family)
LSEALPYLRAAFDEGHGSYSGEYYSLDAHVEPRPSGTRIIVGGSGPVRTPTLAGTHADEYNHLSTPASTLAPKIEIVRRSR